MSAHAAFLSALAGSAIGVLVGQLLLMPIFLRLILWIASRLDRAED